MARSLERTQQLWTTDACVPLYLTDRKRFDRSWKIGQSVLGSAHPTERPRRDGMYLSSIELGDDSGTWESEARRSQRSGASARAPAQPRLVETGKRRKDQASAVDFAWDAPEGHDGERRGRRGRRGSSCPAARGGAAAASPLAHRAGPEERKQRSGTRMRHLLAGEQHAPVPWSRRERAEDRWRELDATARERKVRTASADWYSSNVYFGEPQTDEPPARPRAGLDAYGRCRTAAGAPWAMRQALPITTPILSTAGGDALPAATATEASLSLALRSGRRAPPPSSLQLGADEDWQGTYETESNGAHRSMLSALAAEAADARASGARRANVRAASIDLVMHLDYL